MSDEIKPVANQEVQPRNLGPSTRPLSAQHQYVEIPWSSIRAIIDHAHKLKQLKSVSPSHHAALSPNSSIDAIVHHADLLDRIQPSPLPPLFKGYKEKTPPVPDTLSSPPCSNNDPEQVIVESRTAWYDRCEHWSLYTVIAILLVLLTFVSVYRTRRPMEAPCNPPNADWVGKCWPMDHSLSLKSDKVREVLGTQWDAFLTKLVPEDLANITSLSRTFGLS